MMNEITLYDNETAYEREYAYAVLDEGKLRFSQFGRCEIRPLYSTSRHMTL